MSQQPYDFENVFAVLTPDQGVDAIEITPDLYRELDEKYSGFAGHTLVAVHQFSQDWPTWEKHPAGDEIVVLLSGAATFVLRTETGDKEVALTRQGSYVIVPRNTWHTARVPAHARMLFITPGEGTENQENPAA